ncbi:hypothetical protein LXL04_010585 [Taraxacum kok-saghyz]
MSFPARGEDTRTKIVDHLYASLKRLGIHTFRDRDNEELEKGKRIDKLFDAIEESRFFIIVFSKDYASSSWCLKEVTKIIKSSLIHRSPLQVFDKSNLQNATPKRSQRLPVFSFASTPAGADDHRHLRVLGCSFKRMLKLVQIEDAYAQYVRVSTEIQSCLCSYFTRVSQQNNLFCDYFVRTKSDFSRIYERKSSMASSSKSSIRENFKYHVFLSFRGEDTRKTFVDHLYASLKRLGIQAFRDNEELEKGKRIDELFDAIEESRFFIIVFSKNYASSSWCLKELSKIMECQDGKKRIAYPLFHNVDPSDIRRQSRPVGRAIAKHKADKQIIKIWKKALEDAGNLVGWDLKKIANGHEAEAVDQIVKEISVKLRSVHLSKDENLVGMESRMQNLELSLGIGLDDEVRMIGIKGMGGIGKTTLARAIFHKISSQFIGKSFVDNVREASKEWRGLMSLQKQVLRDVLGDDNVSSVQDAISMMKDRMPSKKVLLVLDDVDHKDQLEVLAGAWFKDGSRIIITTRNEQVLKAHRVNWIHDINFFSDEEAFSLFNKYAFNTHIPIKGYGDLSLKVVKYARGLPLTLKVLGSFLLGKEKAAWEDTLNRLETIPEKETLDILEISYDGLEDDHKQIFLDVACFMRGMRKMDAIRMLESCGFHAIIGLMILEERSLITISNGELGMHDSIQELGRNIVRRSHPHDPNKHSRLWISKEIKELFSDDTVCMKFTALKGLGKLKNLRLLQIFGRHDEMTIFVTTGCWSLPQTFRAKNLVGLELPGSRITKLWESGEREVLMKLRFLDFKDSKLRTLDLGMTPNLERLDLEGCHDLTEIHAPTGCLKRLLYINLVGCSRFNSFSFIQQWESFELLALPKLRVNVESLDNFPKQSFKCIYCEEQASSLENSQKSVSLHLHPGSKLESVSGNFFGLKHLRHLRFHGCIPKVPNDLDQLKCLEKLTLWSTRIKCLPNSICMLKHLTSLKLIDCQHLEELPNDLGHLVLLEKLVLLLTNIKSLPDSICMMKNLKSLKLIYCLCLEELPRDLG